MTTKLFTRLIGFIVLFAACGGSFALAQSTRTAAGKSASQTTAQRSREEVEEQNKKIEAENAAVLRSLNMGNSAMQKNQYSAAVASYRGGLKARPDEPALLTNLSQALRLRGINSWNESFKVTDLDAKGPLKDAARKDWLEAAEVAEKALQVIKSLTDPELKSFHEQNKIAAAHMHALAMRQVAKMVDYTQGRAAWEAYRDYISLETDATSKSQAKSEALQLLLDVADFDEAILQARAVLRVDPKNLDATRVLGMALFGAKKEPEAVIYLRRYMNNAPDTDPFKAETKVALMLLEDTTAEKKPAGRKRP